MAACVAVLHHVADWYCFVWDWYCFSPMGGVIERQRRERYKPIANWGGGITVPYFFLLGKVNGRHAESSLVSEQGIFIGTTLQEIPYELEL